MSDDIPPSITTETHFEIYCLAWFDKQSDSAEFLDTQESLRLFIDYFRAFNALDPCEEYIRTAPADVRIILIVREECDEAFLSRVHLFDQLIVIYFFCTDKQYRSSWTKQYAKVNGFHHELESLLDQVKVHRRRKPYDVDEPLSIRFYHHDTGNEKSIMELNGEFLQTQLLLDCLDRMQTTVTERDDLAALCKIAYETNPLQQALIDHFRQTYSPADAIRWYTRDCFLYRQLNKALRAQDTELLFPFRFIIRDIEKQLREHQCPSPVKVYRGQLIPKAELRLFESSTEKLISVSSFFSTSLDSTVALAYIDPDATDERFHNVLFEIYATPSDQQRKPFAETTSLSYVRDEREVLMMLGSVFQIDSVETLTDAIKLIRLTLCDHHDPTLTLVFDYMRKKRGVGASRLATFGRALIGMAKFPVAEKHFKYLLRTLPAEHADLPDCHHALGKIYCEECRFERSLECLTIALEMLQREPNVSQLRIAYVYNSIGEVYQKKNDAGRALDAFQRALDIFSAVPGDRSENIAWCFNNIGIAYLIEKKYSQALEYLRRALDLKNKLLPDKHPCLGNSLVNLGNVYCGLGDYHMAHKCYQQSLEIFQTSLTQRHPSIARALKNLGAVHELQGDRNSASIYYRRALEFRQQILLANHPDLLESVRDLQRVRPRDALL